MINLMRQTKGAISIFLVIVLLPMLTVAGVFVDMSRLQLAESMAASATDLTLNTALSNYDSVLKDIYGLFATSQSIEEMYDKLEDYYRKSIEAAGVPDVEAGEYVDEIMSMLRSTTGDDDLMKIDVTDFQISKPTGGNLANPAVLKSQIVEFMKYRAPLNLGEGILEALNGMKNLSKQTQLVEDKTDFYDQQKSIMATLESAWVQIGSYQYHNATGTHPFPTGDYLGFNKETLDLDVAPMKEYLKTAVRYYYSSDWQPISGTLTFDEGEDPEVSTDDIWTFNGIVMTNPYSDEAATADNVLQDLNSVLRAYKNLSNIEQEADFSYITKINNSADEVHALYGLGLYNRKYVSKYPTAVKTLLQCLVNLQCALNSCPSEDLADIKISLVEEEYKMYTAELAQYGSVYLAGVAKDQLVHLDNQSGFTVVYRGLISQLQTAHSNYVSGANEKITSANTGVDKIRDDAYAYYNTLSKRAANLSKAIEYLNAVYTELTSSDSAYNKALEKWEKSADNLSDISMGQNDAKEIEELKKILTPEKVQKLITQLTGAKTTVDKVCQQILEYKVLSTSWCQLDDGANISTLRGKFSAELKSKIEAKRPVLDSDLDDVIEELRATVVTGNIEIPTSWPQNENPNLQNNPTELYNWLHHNFHTDDRTYPDGTESEDSDKKTDSGDEDLQKNKDALETKAKENAEKDGNHSSTVTIEKGLFDSTLPSKDKEMLDMIAAGSIPTGSVETNQDTLKENGSDSVNSLLEDVLEALGDMATGFRDDLYVADYIMNMFTYDTMEAEYTVKKDGNSSSFENWYEKKEGAGTYTVVSGREEYAKMAQTLTGNTLSPNLNKLYGGEVEYILYGGEKFSDNTVKSYGTIFIIRFAFNTVYAFTDAEISNATMAAATAIFGVPPLTPLIPVAQVAMIIGLAIAESSWDLYQLKMGESVPLFKSAKNWIMKPSSAAKQAAAIVVDAAIEKVVDYSYDVLDQVLEMTDEELAKLIESGELKIKDITDAALESTMTRLKNCANEAIQEVVELCNNANQQAMFENAYAGLGATEAKVQAVLDGLDDWLEKQKETCDGATLEVKILAVSYLKENGGQAITQIFNKIEETARTAANAGEDTVDVNETVLGTYLDEIRRVLSAKIDNLADETGTKLNELKDQALAELEEAAKEGVSSLKEKLKSTVSSKLGVVSPSSEETTNVVNSLMYWSYSDYLTLFLVIGIMADETGVMLRTADVIQLNMQNMTGTYMAATTEENVPDGQDDFRMKNAGTYLAIKATISVEPIFMKLPFLEQQTSEKLGETRWNEIEYFSFLGY